MLTSTTATADRSVPPTPGAPPVSSATASAVATSAVRTSPSAPAESTSADGGSASSPSSRTSERTRPSRTTRSRTAAPVTSWQLSVPSSLGPDWQQAFLAGYGDDAEHLGLADSPLVIGPEYAAPAPDGSWWVLDAAKKRVAHLDTDGTFLDAVTIGADLLAEGSYFQFQLPRVLADGTVVAVQQSEGPADLLVVSDGKAVVRRTSRQFTPVGDDGRLLYGFAGSTPVSVDPATGVVSDVEFFRSSGGERYLLTTGEGQVTIALPDSAAEAATVPVTGPGGAAVEPHAEVALGDDGVIHLILTALDPASGQVLSGYAAVDPDGTLHPLEPLRPLDSPVDPGTAAHLTVQPGTSRVYLVFVDPEGLRVFGRR